MRRLAWTFAARIGDKYQIRLTRSNYDRYVSFFVLFCLNAKIIIFCHYTKRRFNHPALTWVMVSCQSQNKNVLFKQHKQSFVTTASFSGDHDICTVGSTSWEALPCLIMQLQTLCFLRKSQPRYLSWKMYCHVSFQCYPFSLPRGWVTEVTND